MFCFHFKHWNPPLCNARIATKLWFLPLCFDYITLTNVDYSEAVEWIRSSWSPRIITDCCFWTKIQLVVNLVGLIFSPSYTFSLRELRGVVRKHRGHPTNFIMLQLGLSRFHSRLNLKNKVINTDVELSLVPQHETCQESRA